MLARKGLVGDCTEHGTLGDSSCSGRGSTRPDPGNLVHLPTQVAHSSTCIVCRTIRGPPLQPSTIFEKQKQTPPFKSGDNEQNLPKREARQISSLGACGLDSFGFCQSVHLQMACFGVCPSENEQVQAVSAYGFWAASLLSFTGFQIQTKRLQIDEVVVGFPPAHGNLERLSVGR